MGIASLLINKPARIAVFALTGATFGAMAGQRTGKSIGLSMGHGKAVNGGSFMSMVGATIGGLTGALVATAIP